MKGVLLGRLRFGAGSPCAGRGSDLDEQLRVGDAGSDRVRYPNNHPNTSLLSQIKTIEYETQSRTIPSSKEVWFETDALMVTMGGNGNSEVLV